MSIPKSIVQAKGLWHGKSLLNLLDYPPEKKIYECVSRMHVDIDSNSTYATVTYNWEFKGERQEGTLIICGNKKGNATMGWVDSFHQSSSVLHLEGEELSSGGVKTSGKWKAGEELWGWTIAIELVKEELLFNMEVVTPKGEATWAVKATYRRD